MGAPSQGPERERHPGRWDAAGREHQERLVSGRWLRREEGER